MDNYALNLGARLMRLPRPRFTVRRMMIVVAIIAISTESGMVAWRMETYAIRADAHARHLNSGHSFLFDSTELIHWHERMRLKYENAARNPWLSVDPRSAGAEVNYD